MRRIKAMTVLKHAILAWSAVISVYSVLNEVIITSAININMASFPVSTSKAFVAALTKDDDSEQLPAKVMLWDDNEVEQRHVEQIGTSACGATAVINVLRALGNYCDEEQVEKAVKTRLRDLEAPLPKYLLSRSVAGATHEDLIDGVMMLTKGEIVGQFFSMYPERDVNLSLWLRKWLMKGAVPLLTMNCQKLLLPDGTIHDAWHHQMVCGVSEEGVHVINPNEVMSFDSLSKQLCSESVLLIRRKDVLLKWKPDLDESCWGTDQRWQQLKVKEQVEKVVKEEMLLLLHGNELKHKELVTKYVMIPAAYKSGITVFVKKDTEAYKELLTAGELPVKREEHSPLADQQEHLNYPSTINV